MRVVISITRSASRIWCLIRRSVVRGLVPSGGTPGVRRRRGMGLVISMLRRIRARLRRRFGRSSRLRCINRELDVRFTSVWGGFFYLGVGVVLIRTGGGLVESFPSGWKVFWDTVFVLTSLMKACCILHKRLKAIGNILRYNVSRTWTLQELVQLYRTFLNIIMTIPIAQRFRGPSSFPSSDSSVSPTVIVLVGCLNVQRYPCGTWRQASRECVVRLNVWLTIRSLILPIISLMKIVREAEFSK